jgi:hypothetical protein
VIRPFLWLVGGAVLFWALLTVPARLIWPDDPVLLWSTTAAVLCLAPTAVTLAWTHGAFRGKPEQQLLAVFGGAAVRMGVVLAVGMVLFLNVEAFEHQRFAILIVVYYLFTLALEMALLARGGAAEGAGPKT